MAMIVALALVQHLLLQAPVDVAVGTVDPRGATSTTTSNVPLLPSDTDLRVLAEQDLGQARAPLRRAARTANVAATRALAVRLLATHDASVATARICARSLRLDADAVVRRAAAECLGRLGPRLAGPHTPALVASLTDNSLDVLTMSGWALANAGDAAAIGAVSALATHQDPRVARLFFSYAERLRDRLGLRYDGIGTVTTTPRPSNDAPTAIPPGVVLSFPAVSIDNAAATGWLGLYGAMLGWFHGPLLLSAHGGPAGAESSALAGLGLSALGAAALSSYGFGRADTLRLAHTVVQLGTFGGLAGYGAGQLSTVGPASGVSSANLSLLGSVVGIGMGMAFVETSPPSVGALAAGMATGASVGIAGATLAASYRYPFNQSLGVMLLSGSVAGAATTALLAEQDIGLFPVAGAAAGSALGGGVGALVASAIEPAAQDATEASGWIVVSGLAAGAALGGVVGWLAPTEFDPLLESTLRLNPPTVAVLPGAGIRPEAVTTVMVSGTF